MLITIADNKFIYLDQITPYEEKMVSNAFSVRDPKFRYMDAGFDGWYRKYSTKHRRLARPFLSELIKVCNKYNFPYNIKDLRPAPEYKADFSVVSKDMLPGITLEDYQIRAVTRLAKCEVGCVASPTGSGKTEMIAAICKIFDCPTVVVTDQTIVVQQIKDKLELREIIEEAGLFMAGKRPSGQRIIVGSIQSLNLPSFPKKGKNESEVKFAVRVKGFKTRKNNAAILRKFVAKAHMLIVDEADMASSDSYRNLFWYWFKGRRRYGFSGTFNDPAQPVKNMTLRENLGSIACTITKEEVQKAGRIIPIKYKAIATKFNGDKNDKSRYDLAVKEWLIQNSAWHQIILDLALKHVQIGEGVFILLESIELGLILEQLIPGSKFIRGDTPKKIRWEVIRSFEARETKILIASKVAARGLDLSGGCECLILAASGKLESSFKQKIGRAVRLNSKGEATVYDFLFLCNRYLYDHSRNRIKSIAASGYQAEIVFVNGSMEVDDYVKSRFRIPKNYQPH